MDAKTVYENLLSTIRSSGLNFVLSETPFSLNIVLKKTFISSKNASKLQTSKVPASNQYTEEGSVINKQAMGTNFDQKTGNCSPIRPNLSKQNSTWKTCNKSINIQNNTCQSATTKSSMMKDRPTLSPWHHTTIPAMETTTSAIHTQKMNISFSNSSTDFLNLSNLSHKKTSVPVSSYDVCRSAKGIDEEQDDESNNYSEPNIPTYNKFQVLAKLSKEPSGQAVENDAGKDVKANLSPVLDSEDILAEPDSEEKPEKRTLIDELNIEQLRNYLADYLKPVQM